MEFLITASSYLPSFVPLADVAIVFTLVAAGLVRYALKLHRSVTATISLKTLTFTLKTESEKADDPERPLKPDSRDDPPSLPVTPVSD